MKSTKKIMTLALILALAVSVTACGGAAPAEMTTVATTTTEKVIETMAAEDAQKIDEVATDDYGVLPKDAGTIKWLSFWDINPANGKAVPPALQMFQSKCNGSIEYIETTWADRFDKLSTMVLAGDSPDMFPAADLDVFPKGAIMNVFGAYDEYIDYESELWAPMNNINDLFIYDGKHYVSAIGTDAGTVLIYNKKTIEENGLSDPAKLVAEGTWDWNVFKSMMSTFSNPEEGQYGLDVWWFQAAFSLTTGVPYVGMENGKIVNNLRNSTLEKAQFFLEDLYKNNIPYPVWESWQIAPQNIGLGKTLFYPCGIWALYEADLSNYCTTTEDLMFVPLPKCPDIDDYYLPTGVDAYALVAGAKNPEGVAAYLNCQMICRDDPTIQEIGKAQLFDDYHRTEEMYDMLLTVQNMTEAHPVIDFYGAVNADLNTLIDNGIKNSMWNGASWTQTREEIVSSADAMIETANSKLPTDTAAAE